MLYKKHFSHFNQNFMGTEGRHVEATDVRRDEPNSLARLNAAAIALQIPDRLENDASPDKVAALAQKIKAAIDGITTK